jgi:HK97 family phage major capsid protein
MDITKKLKKWAQANLDVKDTADDNEYKEAVSKALVSGELTTNKYVELTKSDEDEESESFAKQFGRLADNLEKAIETLSKEEEVPETKTEETKTKDTEVKTKETQTQTKDTKTVSKMAKMMAELGGVAETEDSPIDIRVKEAVESYDNTHTAMMFPQYTKGYKPHPLAGQPVTNLGMAVNTPSACDKALAGVWAKFQILSVTPRLAGSPQRAWETLTEHEKSLLAHLAEKGMWDDSMQGKTRTCTGYPGGIKALIDDATSGGTEAAPIVFDDQVITTPLLNGELYPLVNVKPLDRGRRVEGVATGTVTSSWGGVDDTSIALFDTTSYISAFDTTIFRWEGSVRIGLDFLSDTPIDFGAHITAQYGQRLLEDLDDVIATGNGTTQPEGIVNKTGTTAVAWGGTTSIGNYESLRFGVAKAEHSAAVKSSAVFVGTETSYARARALNVGTTDARRLFGMDYDSYSIMERPYKINESMDNTDIFYAIMARYRMYRRKGLTVRTSTEGDTLMRRNEMLIICMARYGGQLERGGAAAVTTSAPA